MSQTTNQEMFYINKCIINMANIDKLRQIDIKKYVIIFMTYLELKILILKIFSWIKNHMKVIQFITFHEKLLLALKQMDGQLKI